MNNSFSWRKFSLSNSFSYKKNPEHFNSVLLFDLSTFPNLLNANKKCQYSSIHLYLLNAQLSHLAKLKKSSVSFFSPPFPHSPHFYCFSRVCDLCNAAWWNEIFFCLQNKKLLESESVFFQEKLVGKDKGICQQTVFTVHSIKMVLVCNFDLTYVTWVLCTVFPFSWKKSGQLTDYIERMRMYIYTSMRWVVVVKCSFIQKNITISHYCHHRRWGCV